MENKIEKLNKKLQQAKGEIATKDKIVARLKNQNAALMEQIMKIKANHEVALKISKIELLVLKSKISQLKTQIDVESQRKIIKLEASLVFTTTTNENPSKDYAALQMVIKDFEKDILEHMAKRLVNLNKLFKLKERVKIELQVVIVASKLHEGTLKIIKMEAEELQTLLEVMSDEDLKIVGPHLKHTLLWRINNIYYLKDLEITIGIKGRTLKVEVAFVELIFDNLVKINMPIVWKESNVQAIMDQ